MNNHVITVVDTTGIQNYIFGSNRLRDNVGASHLVEEATKCWVYQSLKKLGATNIDNPMNDDPFDHNKRMEQDNLVAELIYAGGGNTVILFESLKTACEWTKDYTRKILCDAPGLEVVVVHSEPFEWNHKGCDLYDRITTLMKTTLDEVKQNRVPSVPLLGLGVTATCQSTGLVATDVDTVDQKRISSEVSAKVNKDIQDESQQRFRRVFHDFVRRDKLGLKLPPRFDDLGRSKGEQSYIAVVHADGNNMGERFKEVGKGKTNRDYITSVRSLSLNVQKASTAALNTALAGIIGENGSLVAPYEDSKYIPFRPLVYGGDDVTFVCDGRIGIELAVRYMTAFEEQTKHLLGETLTACAGIAIVKSHYPFARAYALSEELCRNTKKRAREQSHDGVSALDWHIAASGLLGTLKEIRQREYTVSSGTLHMRPIYLRSLPNEWQTWPSLCKVVKEFKHHENWAGKHNKVKRLREVLREGIDATKQFLSLYQLDKLPEYPQAERFLCERGWSGTTCGYFDPIEIMEFVRKEYQCEDL